MSSIMRCRSGLIVVEDGDAGLIEVGVMDVAPVGVTSVMGYSCLNKVVDPVIFRQEPTSRYSPRITPSTPLARSALPRERFRSLTPTGLADHSAFASANLTTLAHFSVSSAMNLPKSAG